jgi:2-oxoglutarate dehydrogenase E1 component
MLRRGIQSLSQVTRNFSDTFSTGSNGYYMEMMYEAYRKDPDSVHTSWKAFFSGLDKGVDNLYVAPPSLGHAISLSPTTTREAGASTAQVKDAIKVWLLHRAYSLYGYMLADLDPLNLHGIAASHNPDLRIPGPIRLSNYKFTDADMEKEFDLGSDMMDGFLSDKGQYQGKWKLRNLLEKLKQVYCGKIGWEYMHIPFKDECNWMRKNIEVDKLIKYTTEQRIAIYEKLARAHLLEEFFHTKFATHKRFGLDGLESLVPAVEAVIERAVEHGVDTFVIGMPHRGRLNVLAHVLNSSLEDMLGQFLGTNVRLLEQGDVKYHLGCTTVREINGKKVTISLLANPSHLEAVDPVALGKTRAIQNYQEDRNRAMTILIHGDAALSGQGVVFETIQMEDLYAYGTGGVVHIVANNNIGFTTTPREGRAGMFPTEVAKSIGAPIFHVNGDCPEHVDYVSRLAAEWRNEFRKSVFVDIIGYRRYGHNELDEPMFTNPLMYKIIQQHIPAFSIYTQQLIDQGVLTQEQVDKIVKSIKAEHENAFKAAKEIDEEELKKRFKTFTQWSSIEVPKSDASVTGVEKSRLKELGIKLNTLHSEVNAHPQISKIYKQRLSAVERETGIDWATGEALSWATILTDEQKHVRISGQDVQRGTFSHRHAVILDQKVDMKKYIPLNNLEQGQATFQAVNSHLSEYGVLGFEYGYSMANPNALVMWEAQFGDFSNGAQIIIDQFITSGEAKWGQQTGLVMLLPHGYDGQGPEHSDAKLGRLLQMSAENPWTIPHVWIRDKSQNFHNNIQIVVPSTPANYFHLLRRQIRRDFRKPLIVFSPKKLLRHKEAISTLDDFTGESVVRVYDDTTPELIEPRRVRKVIACSGQVYYDLLQERRKRDIKDIAIVRVEQLAPFPFDKIQELGAKYSTAEFVWAQEEPLNFGAYDYVKSRFETCLKPLGFDPIKYVGREPGASPATGYSSVHTAQLVELLDKAMH